MRKIAALVAIATLAAPAALAQAASAAPASREALSAPAMATDAVQTARPARVLYICENTAMTRRAFAREHGSAEFVTAAQAAAPGAHWSAPRCITATEARRLKQRQLAAR